MTRRIRIHALSILLLSFAVFSVAPVLGAAPVDSTTEVNGAVDPAG